MLSTLCFTNLSKVHLWPCTCAFLINGWRVSRTIWIICLALSSAALLRVCWWGGTSPHSYPDVSLIFGIWKLWDRLVLQESSSNTLTFWENIDVSAPFLGVLFQNSVSNVFVGVSEVVGEVGVNFHAIFIVGYYRRSMILLLGFCPSNRSSLAEFLRALIPWLPFLIGSLKFLERTTSRLQEIFREVFALPSIFVASRRRRSWRDVFTSLQRDFSCRRLSSCSLRRRELNRGNRIILFVPSCGFFITDLPCHVVTL